MKIWIDGYEANAPQRLGSSQVSFELLKNLEKIDQKNDYTILLPSDPAIDLPQERANWRYQILKPKVLWTRIALPYKLLTTKDKPDVFFSPSHYLPILLPVKSVVTVFDLSYLHFPKMFLKKDLYKLTHWTASSIKKANKIVTISQSSKKDIIQNYPEAKNKVLVAYPGYNAQVFYPIKDRKKIEAIKSKFEITGSYIIFVGTIQPRKNLTRLIEAFKKIDNLKLVIVGKIKGQGKEGWMYEDILNLPKELDIEDKVIFTNFVADDDLKYLVNGATAAILPSLWEGFGIPIVDAMACGVPIIVSNVSSLPEVVGDAGLLVDPESVTQIEQAIRLISTDKKLWQQKSKLSLKQAKKFSWRNMARQVLKVLEEVGGSK